MHHLGKDAKPIRRKPVKHKSVKKKSIRPWNAEATNLGKTRKRKCKCQGAVENCSFCFGSGEVTYTEDVPVSHRAVPPKKAVNLDPLVERFGTPAARKKIGASLASRVEVCDRCAFHGSPEALRAHMEKEHPDPEIREQRRLQARQQERRKREKEAEARRGTQDLSGFRRELDAFKKKVALRNRLEQQWKAAVEQREKLVAEFLTTLGSSKHQPSPVAGPDPAGLQLPQSTPRQPRIRATLIAQGLIREAKPVPREQPRFPG
jgi:hypothetical protein